MTLIVEIKRLLLVYQGVWSPQRARFVERGLHSGRGPSRKGMLVVHLREFW